MAEKRYGALRTIGSIYKIFGIITGVITVLLALGLCATSIFGTAILQSLLSDYGPDFGGMLGGVLTGVIGGLLIILYGGAFSLALYAAGEGVYLLVALEENTRETAMLLQRQINPPFPPR